MQHDDIGIFCKCTDGSVRLGMSQDGAACAAGAAPLCCKTQFLPHSMEATTGVSPFAIPVRIVYRQRKEVILRSPEPTRPTGHVKDILKEWHPGQAGWPFIYPADPACRPDHIASSSLLALSLRRRGSSSSEGRYPDVFATASSLDRNKLEV